MPDQPTPTTVPRTEREHWVDIANALNAALDAGMPVGIDLDGTLTDHTAWSVVWDEAAQRWTVAGYDADENVGVEPRPVDSPRPDDALARLADLMALQQRWKDGRLVSESLIPQRQIRAALGWPEPQTATDVELSAYDLAELVAFDVKVQNDGFHYAYEEYGPRFESPVLTALASDVGRFEAFHEARQDEISAWWDQEGADVLYDQHIDEARRRRYAKQ